MKALLYYPLYLLLWLITLLPLCIIYLISDLIFVPLYYISGYRRKTIFRNLSQSFPEKSPGEIKNIAKLFYHQLIDYFLEWMYRMHMGARNIDRRMKLKNVELLEEYRSQGKSVILLMNHYGNWEWTTRISQVSKYTTLAIYKPLRNKFADRLFLKLRGKFGIIGVPMKSSLREINEYRQKEIPVLIYTLADQRPEWGSLQHWTRFLNQDTPVITGPEKIARKYKMPVLFLSINRTKRGYYEAEFHLISDDPSKNDEFDITLEYLRKTEDLIIRRPELWLWSHKRWKYKRDDARTAVDIDKQRH